MRYDGYESIKYLLFLFFFLAPAANFAQLSRDDIKEILIIQGTSPAGLESKASGLYEAYIDKTSFRQDDIPLNTLSSFGAGFMMAMHQSNTGLYKHTEWLPGFMRNWYSQSLVDVKTEKDGVFAKTFTIQKVFRELDYYQDRLAYENWNRFFGSRFYFTFPVHWIIKNFSASIFKHRMKYGKFF
jgi:hypothetical protein